MVQPTFWFNICRTKTPEPLSGPHCISFSNRKSACKRRSSLISFVAHEMALYSTSLSKSRASDQTAPSSSWIRHYVPYTISFGRKNLRSGENSFIFSLKDDCVTGVCYTLIGCQTTSHLTFCIVVLSTGKNVGAFEYEVLVQSISFQLCGMFPNVDKSTSPSLTRCGYLSPLSDSATVAHL